MKEGGFSVTGSSSAARHAAVRSPGFFFVVFFWSLPLTPMCLPCLIKNQPERDYGTRSVGAKL